MPPAAVASVSPSAAKRCHENSRSGLRNDVAVYLAVGLSKIVRFGRRSRTTHTRVSRCRICTRSLLLRPNGTPEPPKTINRRLTMTTATRSGKYKSLHAAFPSEVYTLQTAVAKRVIFRLWINLERYDLMLAYLNVMLFLLGCHPWSRLASMCMSPSLAGRGRSNTCRCDIRPRCTCKSLSHPLLLHDRFVPMAHHPAQR